MVTNIYATCLKVKNKGVLIIGNSGSGKSDLALRLIYRYKASLVADDRVDISVKKGKITASAPKVLKNLLEVRGVGIVKIKSSALTSVVLVVELTDKIERMPELAEYEIEGIKLPLVKINPFEDSAPEKVLCALSLL